MSTSKFLSKSQIFDLDKTDSAYIPVLKVLFNTPRLYEELYTALSQKIPNFKKVTAKLIEQGFVDKQDPIIVNTITGVETNRVSKPVHRYLLTRFGRKKLTHYLEDPEFFSGDFKKVDIKQRSKVIELLSLLDLQPPHSRYGLSVNHIKALINLNPRTLRWWLDILIEKEMIHLLDDKYGDTRVLIPSHMRVNKNLARQLETVVETLGGERNLVLLKSLRSKRSKYLADIKVARVGINGATDYEHDIDTQRILAKFVLSDSFAMSNLFEIEPRVALKAEKNNSGDYVFTDSGSSVIFYQPDALFKEKNMNGSFAYSFLEYERFQTRRDGWDHIEKFVGFMYQKTLPFETGVLRFVVDGKNRERVYVKLIEAFTDSVLDNPSLLPSNPLSIQVTTIESVLKSKNPLVDGIWHSIDLPTAQSKIQEPKLHSGTNPYSDYFARGRQW